MPKTVNLVIRLNHFAENTKIIFCCEFCDGIKLTFEHDTSTFILRLLTHNNRKTNKLTYF